MADDAVCCKPFSIDRSPSNNHTDLNRKSVYFHEVVKIADFYGIDRAKIPVPVISTPYTGSFLTAVISDQPPHRGFAAAGMPRLPDLRAALKHNCRSRALAASMTQADVGGTLASMADKFTVRESIVGFFKTEGLAFIPKNESRIGALNQGVE